MCLHALLGVVPALQGPCLSHESHFPLGQMEEVVGTVLAFTRVPQQ